MKTIKYAGIIYQQEVEPLDCIMCPYRDGCSSWGCVSPACGITRECFGFSRTASWCPFGDKEKPGGDMRLEIIEG